MYFRIVYIFLLSILPLFSFLSYSCEEIFGSRFVDVVEERALQKRWNEKPKIPALLKFLLPQGVHFIKRQLYQPGNATAVKLGEWGSEVIARTHHKYEDRVFHTNVVFSTRALMDNLKEGGKHNWLVGKNATAAFLFLHGGGTKSTGFHVGANMVTRFSHYGIDVISVDLGWHGQGHREFLNVESDIGVLSSFVKKYVPPHVPLFVIGHSWGSVFSELIMRRTDRPTEEFSFHPNLQGVVILSTALDAAPGKSE